jgi:hypothetical protein
MSQRSRARKLQRATGMSYQQALEMVRRDARRAAEQRVRGRPTLAEAYRALAAALEGRSSTEKIQVLEVAGADDPLAALCAELREAAAAVAVRLFDRDRKVIAQAGGALGPWALLVARAPGAGRAAPEPNDLRMVELDERRTALLQTLAGGELLAVLFDQRSSLGLVRLRIMKMKERFEELLARRGRRDWVPPRGRGGPGGAPAHAFESVEIFALEPPVKKN